jgi:ribosomal protein L32
MSFIERIGVGMNNRICAYCGKRIEREIIFRDLKRYHKRCADMFIYNEVKL